MGSHVALSGALATHRGHPATRRKRRHTRGPPSDTAIASAVVPSRHAEKEAVPRSPDSADTRHAGGRAATAHLPLPQHKASVASEAAMEGGPTTGRESSSVPQPPSAVGGAGTGNSSVQPCSMIKTSGRSTPTSASGGTLRLRRPGRTARRKVTNASV